MDPRFMAKYAMVHPSMTLGEEMSNLSRNDATILKWVVTDAANSP